MKALPIGTVSKFYSFLPQSIQAKVSIEFKYITENELVRMLDLLARVRNVCAHNERLFNYRYNKGAINDTYIHKYLNIPKSNVQYSKGKQDLFAIIIVLKYLLNPSEFSCFVDDINDAIETLLVSTKQLQQTQMYKYMGFPINWLEIKGAPLLKKHRPITFLRRIVYADCKLHIQIGAIETPLQFLTKTA